MFEISELQKRDLLKYLAQRPYIEVAALVNMIASLKLIKKENGKLFFKKYWKVRFVPLVSGIN